jgi:hypothetical protein
MDREAKRQMDTEPQPNNFLLLGRELQNKRGPPGAWASAERDFREFFGAGCVVVAILWRMLNEHDLVPEGGKIVHLLYLPPPLKDVDDNGDFIDVGQNDNYTF